VPLPKVWGKIVGDKNPKWPPSATFKISFSMVCLKSQSNIAFTVF